MALENSDNPHLGTDARVIHKNNKATQRELADLLHAIFIGELLQPSKHLWIVSPWISDIEAIDNRSNSLRDLIPDLPATGIPLTTVLSELLKRGTHVIIATTKDPKNDAFIRAIKHNATAIERDHRLRLNIEDDDDRLHNKGILGDSFHLSGSMNLTIYGVTINKEYVRLDTSKDSIDKAWINLMGSYPSVEITNNSP